MAVREHHRVFMPLGLLGLHLIKRLRRRRPREICRSMRPLWLGVIGLLVVVRVGRELLLLLEPGVIVRRDEVLRRAGDGRRGESSSSRGGEDRAHGIDLGAGGSNRA